MEIRFRPVALLGCLVLSYSHTYSLAAADQAARDKDRIETLEKLAGNTLRPDERDQLFSTICMSGLSKQGVPSIDKTWQQALSAVSDSTLQELTMRALVQKDDRVRSTWLGCLLTRKIEYTDSADGQTKKVTVTANLLTLLYTRLAPLPALDPRNISDSYSNLYWYLKYPQYLLFYLPVTIQQGDAPARREVKGGLWHLVEYSPPENQAALIRFCQAAAPDLLPLSISKLAAQKLGAPAALIRPAPKKETNAGTPSLIGRLQSAHDRSIANEPHLLNPAAPESEGGGGAQRGLAQPWYSSSGALLGGLLFLTACAIASLWAVTTLRHSGKQSIRPLAAHSSRGGGIQSS